MSISRAVMREITIAISLFLTIVQLLASPLPPPPTYELLHELEEQAELKGYQFIDGQLVTQETLKSDDDAITYRLPNNTLPVRYDVWVKTDVQKEDFEFIGRVKIQIRACEDTDYVVLQYRDLIIDQISLVNIENHEIIVANVSYEYLLPLSHEFLKIHLPNPVKFNESFIVDISYHGELHEADNNGFYKAYYTNANGTTVWYATTKFEPHHARHLMPCYDEPAIRAPIALKVQHDKSYNTYSNMRLKTRDLVEGSDYAISTFEDTPPMQTYLLAFLVSDFKYTPNNAVDVPQRIFAKPQSIDDGEADYAASISDDVLKKFEQLLDMKYPLSKLDHAAITQFPSGAMENFGFISYRESVLILSKNYTQAQINSSKKTIARIFSHEVAHQWFGNTVAPLWWTHLWLNEGFATLYEYLVPHILFPSLGFDEDFRMSCLQSSLRREVATASTSVPMSHYVEEPSAIRGRFNFISYQKSGAVLMMFMEALGTDIFHKGLTKYLDENYFGVGDPQKLFTALQSSYGDISVLNVESVMGSWTTQAGYPILHVDVNGSKLKFTQKRYLTGSGEIYAIPLTYATKSNPDFDAKTARYWMRQKEEEIDLGLNETDWIIFNNKQVGYYRVGYSDDLWLRIAKALQFDNTKVHLINRRILQEELNIGMTVSENIQGSTMLEVLRQLEYENNYLVWSDANNNFQFLNRILFNTDVHEKYMEYLQAMTQPIIDRIGLEGTTTEAADTTQLRLHVKAINCNALGPNCMQHENTKLINYHEDENRNSAPSDFCAAFRLATQDIYTHYLNESVTNVKLKNRDVILKALHCTLKEDLISMLTATVEDKTNILNATDRSNIINSMLISSSISFNAAFDYIERNVKELDSFKSQIKTAINTQETFDKLKLMLSEALNDKVLTKEQVDEIEATVEGNLKWHDKHSSGIREYFGIVESTTLAANGLTTAFYLVAASLIAINFVR